MKFAEKNDFIVKHKNGKFFDKDLELFKKHCPNSPLNSDLNRVNDFTRVKLDGLMLSELLDKISMVEILENRKHDQEKTNNKNTDAETIKTIDKVKEIFVEEGIEVDLIPEEILCNLVGKTINELKNFINIGKIFQSQQVQSDEQKDTEINQSDKISETESEESGVKKEANLVTETEENSDMSDNTSEITTKESGENKEVEQNTSETNQSSTTIEKDTSASKKKGVNKKNSPE